MEQKACPLALKTHVMEYGPQARIDGSERHFEFHSSGHIGLETFEGLVSTHCSQNKIQINNVGNGTLAGFGKNQKKEEVSIFIEIDLRHLYTKNNKPFTYCIIRLTCE